MERSEADRIVGAIDHLRESVVDQAKKNRNSEARMFRAASFTARLAAFSAGMAVLAVLLTVPPSFEHTLTAVSRVLIIGIVALVFIFLIEKKLKSVLDDEDIEDQIQ